MLGLSAPNFVRGQLRKIFEEIFFSHIGREKNWFANALVTLTSITIMDYEKEVQPLQIEVRDVPTYYTNLRKKLESSPCYHGIQ